VQRGDSLDRIARRHGTTVQELAEINQLADLGRIPVGRALKLSEDSSVAFDAGERYRVEPDIGVNVRAQPGGARIGGLPKGAIVGTTGEEATEAGGHVWLRVRDESSGLVGWVAREFLVEAGNEEPNDRPEPRPGGQGQRYQVASDIGVNVRSQPGGDRVGGLPDGAFVVATGEGPTDAGGHSWLRVRDEGSGLVGWVAREYLNEVPVPPPNGLPNEPDHHFGFQALRATIEAAAGEFGADMKVVAAILAQESGFTNWRVHRDGTGHGLIGLDDNGLLPDFERWSGLSCGRGFNAISIPPGLQIRYCAKTIAAYTRTYGSAYNAARVWHRGPNLWTDQLGDIYEDLIDGHIGRLFG